MRKKIFSCLFCGMESFSYNAQRKFCTKKCFVLFQKKEHKEKYTFRCCDCLKEVDYRNKRCRVCEGITRRGKKLSDEVKAKVIKHLKPKFGKMCNFYIDGSSTLTRLIRCNSRTSVWRNEIFKKDNYTCSYCFKRGGYLEANHKKPFRKIFDEFILKYSQFSVIEDKETLLRLALSHEEFWDTSNGETVCKECHLKLPTSGRPRK